MAITREQYYRWRENPELWEDLDAQVMASAVTPLKGQCSTVAPDLCRITPTFKRALRRGRRR